MVLEKTLESPLDCKEIQPVYPKGDQSWIFIGRTDAEAETPILLPPHAKNQVIWKDPDAGKDWRQEKGTTEDEMVGCHHQLNSQESEQTLGDCEGQGSLESCSSWGHKELDTTEQLNNKCRYHRVSASLGAHYKEPPLNQMIFWKMLLTLPVISGLGWQR